MHLKSFRCRWKRKSPTSTSTGEQRAILWRGAAHLTTVAAHNVNSVSVRWQMFSQGLMMQLHTSASISPPTLPNMEASLFLLRSNLQQNIFVVCPYFYVFVSWKKQQPVFPSWKNREINQNNSHTNSIRNKQHVALFRLQRTIIFAENFFNLLIRLKHFLSRFNTKYFEYEWKKNMISIIVSKTMLALLLL